jgi:hypothetical protein
MPRWARAEFCVSCGQSFAPEPAEPEPFRENIAETLLAFVFWPVGLYRWIDSYLGRPIALTVTVVVFLVAFAILAGVRL